MKPALSKSPWLRPPGAGSSFAPGAWHWAHAPWLAALLALAPILNARAAEAAFTLNTTTVLLTDVTEQVAVQYRSLRLNRATGTWNAEVVVTNRSHQAIQIPLLLVIDGFSGTTGPLATDGADSANPPRPFYDLSWQTPSGRLNPGEITTPRTIVLGVGSGPPQLITRVHAHPAGTDLALTSLRTLNEAGQPLPRVVVTQTGPGGTDSLETDLETALITLGTEAGAYAWRFDHPARLPAWRQAFLTSGQVSFPASPWLVARSPDSAPLTTFEGGQLTCADGSLSLRYGPGSVLQDGTLTLTLLAAQTLPTPLPIGWSPLQAFWIESTEALRQPATASIKPWGRIGSSETAALVQWNESSLAWEVAALLPGKGPDPLSVPVAGTGAFALVVGDPAPNAPPAPAIGQALQAAALPPPDPASLTATGQVDPPTSLASLDPRLVTATATVTLTNTAGPLPSGTVLRTEISENYQLHDGSRRQPPPYEHTIVAYQRPGDTHPNTLQAQFPLRPLLLLGPETLASAVVKVDVVAGASFTGTILDARGGALAIGNVRLLAGAGTFDRPQTTFLRSLDPAAFTELIAGEGAAIAAFELTTSGPLTGAPLHLDVRDLVPNLHYVLARVLTREGWYGLEPTERLATDALGRLATLEPETGDRLPGLRSAGPYVLIQTDAPLGLITGVARNASGDPVGGVPARLPGHPWLTFSHTPSGTFHLLAPAGSTELEILDPLSGNAGQTTVTIVDPAIPVTVSLATIAAGPRVVAVSPAAGSTGVSRVTPVTLEFSKPLHPASLGVGRIQLVGTNGLPVPASLSLNLRNTLVTLLPNEPLSANALHTVVLDPTLTDATGQPLEGETSFAFTTIAASARNVAAQLTSHEPDEHGLAALVGDPGLAEPEAPVILVNETTGATATVLSQVDGSFSNAIPAGVDDELSAVLVNANGTRTVIPVSRQLFQDGSVGLFEGGGTLEAHSESGVVQVFVIPGSIPNKTRFKLHSIPLPDLAPLINEAPLEDGKILGGLTLGMTGDEPTESLDLSFPVDPASLNLPPDADPADASFVLAAATQVDGVIAYQVLDKMDYEDGRVATHSLPFLGIAAFALRASWQLAEISGYAASPDAALQEIMLLPIFISARKAYTVFGYAAQGASVDEAGRIEAGTGWILPGTVVTLRPVERPFPVIQGRLDPGSLFSVTDVSGKYSLRIGIADASGFILTATHPTIPGQRQTAPVPNFTLDRPYARKDIVFPFATGTAGDLDPPLLDVSHTPFRPPAEGTAELRVRITDASPSPHLAVSVSSAVESTTQSPLPLGTITLAHSRTETISAAAQREFYEVTSSTNTQVRVELELVGSDAAGNQSRLRYPIWFGGGDPASTNAVASYDPSDQIGPTVTEVWPPQDHTALTPGSPIQIRFNEPIDRAVLADPTRLACNPPTIPPTLELSADQTILTLGFSALTADTDYTLTLGSSIRDLRGNSLDQDPATAGASAFLYSFHTAPAVQGRFAGILSGGGTVVRGIYAYVLERKGSDFGALRVFDLSNPTAPVSVADYRLPPFPRDLVLIPDYAYRLQPGQPARTNDLLAIVGGLVGGSSIAEGGNALTAPWLRVLDLSNPLQPRRLAGAQVNLDPTVALTRLRWSAPVLGYLETSIDQCSIGVVNLQAFILSESLGQTLWDTYPPDGLPGRDANGDGDYADPDDEVPIPSRLGSFAGKIFAYQLPDARQWIHDFTLDWGGGVVTVALEAGSVLDANGQPTAIRTPAAFRYLFKWGYLDRNACSYKFTNGTPTRITFLPATPVSISNQVSLIDLAVVTVRPQSGTYHLLTFDATDPTDLRLLSRIDPPQPSDILYGVHPREDGLLALASGPNLLLLDPRRLAAAPATTNAVHPAIVGSIAGAGSGNRTLASVTAGLNAVSLLGNNRVIQSPPSLRFVSFTNLLDAATLVDDPATLSATLPYLEETTALQAVRLASGGGTASTASPPNPAFHYYVLVDAPGSAGPTLQLGLESLNRAGFPLQNRGRDFAPVRALTAATLADLDQTPRAGCDAPIRPLTAYRLSANPARPLYNVYLSKPFCVTYEKVSRTNLLALQAELDREVLWAGHSLRAILEPSQASNPVIGPFAGQVDPRSRIIAPGPAARAETLPGTYLMGPNPPPLGSPAEVPGTFGTVNALNGEFRHHTLDIALPGRRLPIAFERSVGGQDLYDGPLGRGWDFNYNQNLTELRPAVFAAGSRMPLVQRAPSVASTVAEGRDVLFHNGAGQVVVFRYHGNSPPPEVASDPLVSQLGWDGDGLGYYLPEPGSFDLLFRFPDGRFARLTPEGEQFWYSRSGRLDKIYDRYPASQLVLAYNLRGELAAITDKSVPNDARFLRIGFWRLPGDPLFVPGLDDVTSQTFVAGRICRLQDYAGRDILFHYTDDGILEYQEGVHVSGANGGFSGRSRTTYLMTSSCSGMPHGLVAGSASLGTPLFVATVNAEAVASGGHGAFGPVTLTPPPVNRADSVAGSVSTSVGPSGETSQFTFDARGYPSHLNLSGPGAPPAEFQTTYNDFGLPQQIVYPEGNSVAYTYDTNSPSWRSRGNLLSVTKDPGRRGGDVLSASFHYDARYNLPAGAQTTFNGDTLSYTLTPDGRAVSRVDYPGVGSHRFTHDPNYGQLLEETTADGRSFRSVYNAAGFPTESHRGPDATTFQYDAATVAGRLGQPTGLLYGRGANASIAYDERLQPVRFARRDYEQLWAYDENGNPIFLSHTGPAGRRYEETRLYTQISFLKEVSVQQVETDDSLQDLVTTFTPDASWRIARMTHPDGAITDYTYDPRGHILTLTQGPYVEQFDRDLHGNVTAIRQGGDLVRTFLYDGHDRVLTLENRLESATETTAITYFPDGQQRTLTITDARFGIVHRREIDALDSLGRPLVETLAGDQTDATRQFGYLADATGLTLEISGPVDTQTLHYDTAGRLTSQESPAGTHLAYTYDANGNLEQLESTEDGTTYLTARSYDDLDHPTETRDALGVLSTYTPAPDGSLTEITDALGATLQQQFSVLGELLSRQRANGVAFQHAWDARRRLTFVGDPLQGYHYTFDTPSGRLTRHGLRDGSAYEYPDVDARLHPTRTALPGGQALTRYDWQGRLTSLDVTGSGGARYQATFELDALGRTRAISYGDSGAHHATYAYDRLGPLTEATHEENGTARTIHYTIRPDSTRDSLTYPSALLVSEDRRDDGRLLVVRDGSPLYQVATFAGRDMPKDIVLGDNVLREHREYDRRRRLLARRYERASNGALLADTRYVYDPADNPVARQELHRHGRADLYAFDDGHRLTRAEIGARPEVPNAVARSVPGLSGGLGLQPGFFAHTYTYDTGGLDLLESVPTINPDGLSSPPFAVSRSDPDGFLHLQQIDGFHRGPAAAQGNVPRSLLAVRDPGSAAPVPMAADLEYDGLSRLIRVTRADGIRIEYQYRPNGLVHHRRVQQGSTTLSDRAFVYDGQRLIEEYEGGTLAARYLYADSDSPFAADLLQPGGLLARFYLLQDALGSIVALTDATGEVMERISYDPWGQAAIEAPDRQPPAIARVEVAGSALLWVTFTERILPPLTTNSAGSGLITSTTAWGGGTSGALQLTDGTGAISVTLNYLETSRPDLGYGTTIALTPARPIIGAFTLRTAPGAFVDEWGLTNSGESLPLSSGLPGTVLYAGAAPGSTAAPRHARSPVGLSLLFQGHYQDYEAGLLYLKQRFYDPYTGTFLQLDPADYQDSVNLYAGFANNPVANVDPDGTQAATPRLARLSRRTVRTAASEDLTQAISRVARAPSPGNDLASVRRFLQHAGLTSRETKALEQTLSGYGADVRLSIRSWRDPAARQALTEQGLRAKPAHWREKTKGAHTSVPTRGGGAYDAVSDMDILHLSINGRTASEVEFREFARTFNRNLLRQGGRPSIMHGFHTMLGPNYGKKYLGKTIDTHYLEEIGHPGDSFTISSKGVEGLSAFHTPRHVTDADILEAENALKFQQLSQGEVPMGFPPSWHTWDKP